MSSRQLERLFLALTARPKLTVCLALVAIIAMAAGLTQLVKDTSVDAFIPADHPSLAANERVRELFGLSDTLAVAVFVEDGETVFAPSTMAQISRLTQTIAGLANIRADRVISLSTESYISGDGGSIDVGDYVQDGLLLQQDASRALERWQLMPPHINALVSADTRGAIIMAELIDDSLASETYQEVLTALEASTWPGLSIEVAGPAAVSGYLSDYIDADARVMQPFVFVVVLLFVYFAFLRARALLGPLLVLLGAAGGSLGVMAWLGIPYYAITNALPVILVAISVADAIHLLSAFFTRRAAMPGEHVRESVVAASVQMAPPITLTTLTTIAGFAGIAAVSIMPPIAWFAIFALFGVALAWLFSLVALPAALVLINPEPSPLFAIDRRSPSASLTVATLLGRLASASARAPAIVVASVMFFSGLALFLASGLTIDRSQVDNFAHGEPIRVADERINDAFAGTSFLDVIIESEEPDGLLSARAMERIADLQTFLERQPHVSKTVSIVDYLSLLHSAIAGEQAIASRPLPSTDDAIAQYLMVYEASGDPSDFDEEITPDYQAALVRGVLSSSWHSDGAFVVEALQGYLADHFADGALRASIAGDVNVSYHWMSRLEDSHFAGVGLSLALILLMSIVVFRSISVGVIAVLPVSLTVLSLYAVMATLGIHLEPATSMFAAISVGVGVDFAIHLISGLRSAPGDVSVQQKVGLAAPAIARACFFNAAALGVGFSVLMLSDLPTLQRFGGLVCVASVISFFSALLVVPAGLAIVERFSLRRTSALATAALVFLIAGGIAITQSAGADSLGEPVALDASAIAAAVANRPEPSATKRLVDMTLIDRRGRERQRQAVIFRLNEDDQRTTRITYLAPSMVRELTFLSADARDVNAQDHRWLYIPAARKVRRVPPSDRGDYFLGTDFSFEDIQADFRFDEADYTFALDGEIEIDGEPGYRLIATPRTSKIAKELGYGRLDVTIEARSWFPRRIEFSGTDGKPLKVINITALRRVDNIWTPEKIVAEHLRTGHQTVFRYSQIEHLATLPKTLLRASELNRGLPPSW